MTLQEAKEIKTQEVTKGNYKCFSDLLSTHSHKHWLLEVLDEAAELYARSKWNEACEQQIKMCLDRYIRMDVYDHSSNFGTIAREMDAINGTPKPEFKP